MSVAVEAGLVSTIIPVYNRPALVVEAVESVLRQTHRPVEVIIVDDGSTDDTPAVLARLCRTYPEVRSIRRANGGVGAARETGRQDAVGEFIQYLDSDDLLLPDKFRLQVAALREMPQAGIAYGKSRHGRIHAEVDPGPCKRTGERHEYLYPAILQSRWWTTSTPLFRRSVVDAIGAWQNLRNEEDWEYETRAAVLGTKLVYCDEFVSVRRFHDDHLSYAGSTHPLSLQHRARAQKMIYEHLVDADMIEDIPEWDHYIRALFLLARQCGRAGLTRESRELHAQACAGARRLGRRYLSMHYYRWGATVLGWRQMGRLAHAIDALRSR